MRPIGYMYKRIAGAPAGLGAPHVVDVYSLSSHVSENFADYTNYWRHNGYWLFDSPATVRALAKEQSLSLDGLRLFYYEAHDLQYDDALGEWVSFEPEASFTTNIEPPTACTLEGFDVTTFSAGTSPECSPLSCNGLAGQVPTNSHCLMPSMEAAVQALEAGRFKNTEPGPYRIIGVYSVHATPVTTMIPSIRRALPSDAPGFAECVRAAYAPWVPRIGREPWPMLQDYRMVIDTQDAFVAECDGQLSGVLVLSETDDGFLIDNVAVLPTLKGQGIGRALLTHAEAQAKARGYRSIYLYTNEAMVENIALYARIGYVEYERRQEQGFRRVFMRKQLEGLS